MKIIADVRVWREGGGSKDVAVEITREDLIEMAEIKALKLVDGLAASVVDIKADLSF